MTTKKNELVLTGWQDMDAAQDNDENVAFITLAKKGDGIRITDAAGKKLKVSFPDNGVKAGIRIQKMRTTGQRRAGCGCRYRRVGPWLYLWDDTIDDFCPH